MKSKALLDSFTAYCAAHPEHRFWQALRNWSGHHRIAVESIGTETSEDTFYWNGRTGFEAETPAQGKPHCPEHPAEELQDMGWCVQCCDFVDPD